MTFRNYLEGEDDKPYFHLNSLAHYYEKMEGFAAVVENAAKTLNLTKEEIDQRVTAYILENKTQLDQRLGEWDEKLQQFDGSVTDLLAEWVDDGTLNHIIDTTLIDQKIQPLTALLADKVGGQRKLKPEEFSDDAMALVTGNGTVNVLSVPQDSSVTNKKLTPDSIYPHNLNKRIINEKTHTIEGIKDNQTLATEPLYIAFAYDGLNRNADPLDILAEYDFISKSTNIKDVRLKVFVSNTQGGNPLPITYSRNNNTTILETYGYIDSPQPHVKRTGKLTVDGAITGAGRYIKIYVSAYLIDSTLPASFEVPYMNLTVNGKELPLDGVYKYQAENAVLISETNVRSLTTVGQLENFIKKDELPATVGRWQGKKAVFLGDSITRGTFGGGVAVKPYHQWLKELLGLETSTAYGSNGTHISANYIDDAETASPTASFTNRYLTMDNDADLIVVFGGTNDYGHTSTAPFGTMADTTDISFYGGLRVLMSGLRKKYMGKTIVFMTPTHRDNDTVSNATTGKTLNDYRKAIIEVAEFYGIRVIDTYAVSGLNPIIPEVKTTYMNDGLHPNEVGHELLGKTLAPVFNSF